MIQVAHLLWWLGPWSSTASKPSGVVRRRVVVPASRPGERAFDGWYYLPERGEVRGAYLIVPGLHHLGASDPRLDRFCRILTASGIAAFSPYIGDYQDHMVTWRAAEETRRAFRHMRTLPGQPATRPGIWSISLGSLLAFSVAGDPELAEQVGGLFCFGGYASWDETIRFAVTGRDAHGHLVPRDPLNQPAVYMNLFAGLEGTPKDPRALFTAWRRYMRATWGNPDFRAAKGHLEVARAIAPSLPVDQRELFLAGCGDGPRNQERALEALDRCPPGSFDHCDPMPHIANLRCPVHIMHASEDPVIPLDQQAQLVEAMPPGLPVHTYTTGLFGHTDTDASVLHPRRLREAFDEVATMLRMVEALAEAADDVGR